MIPNEILAVFASAVVAYFLGSIPFAYLAARMAGVDIFAVGTGNPGASNVFRKVGRGYGAAVFILDIAKGAVAVFAGVLLGCPEVLLPVAAVFAIVGHWLPVFLRFRGGAGLATGVGIGLSLLGIWLFVPMILGIATLLIVRDGPRTSAVVLVTAVITGVATGPNWVALGGIALVLLLMVGRLFLVEMPRDKRGDRPDPDARRWSSD